MSNNIDYTTIKDTVKLYKECIYNAACLKKDASIGKYDTIVFLLAISEFKLRIKYYDYKYSIAGKNDSADITIPAYSYTTDLGCTNHLLNIVRIYVADKLQPFMPVLLGEDNFANAISKIEFENESETIKDHILNILGIILDKWRMDPSDRYNSYSAIDDIDTFINISKNIMQCINDEEIIRHKYYPKSCADYIYMYGSDDSGTYVMNDSMMEDIVNHYKGEMK